MTSAQFKRFKVKEAERVLMKEKQKKKGPIQVA